MDGLVATTATAGREPALPDLDEGEAASIRLALASGPDVLVLFDERAGRGVAHELALRLAGSAAVIGMARLRGLIPQGPYGCGFFCGVQPGWPPPRLRLCGKNDPPPTEPHREFALHSRKQTHGEMSFSPPTSAPVLLPPDLPLTREQRLASREFSTAGRIAPG